MSAVVKQGCHFRRFQTELLQKKSANWSKFYKQFSSTIFSYWKTKKKRVWFCKKKKKPEIPRVANKKLQVNLSFDISELRKKRVAHSIALIFFDKTGVLDVRTLYWGTLENPTKCHQQNSWVSKQLVKWSTFTANKPTKFQYIYKSRPICATAFQHLLPIGKNRMIKLREDIKQLGKFFSRMLASDNGWRCIYFYQYCSHYAIIRCNQTVVLDLSCRIFKYYI